MGVVVSFSGYTPAARYDGNPWTIARVQEAPTSAGSWTTIENINLSSPDADPENPATRNLTTELGTGNDLWYRIIWLDGAGDTSEPTDPIRNITGPSDVYVSAETLKRTLTLSGTQFADDDVDVALMAASRGLDEACGRFFGRDSTVSSVRYYRPQSSDLILIDDLSTSTGVTLETDQFGENSFSRSWTLHTEFELEPLNAIADNWPYTRLVRNPWRGTLAFPYWAPRSVKLTGYFGWPAIPSQIVTATSLIASRLLKRTREAPFGVLMGGLDVGAAVHIARNDPDVVGLLAPFVREKIV